VGLGERNKMGRINIEERRGKEKMEGKGGKVGNKDGWERWWVGEMGGI